MSSYSGILENVLGKLKHCYTCVLISLYVSSYCCRCVLMQYPHTAVDVYSCCLMCPHTSGTLEYVLDKANVPSADKFIPLPDDAGVCRCRCRCRCRCLCLCLCLRSYRSLTERILLYMCRHATICVLMLLYMCPHATIHVSSYYYICVVMLLYICPHTLADVCAEADFFVFG